MVAKRFLFLLLFLFFQIDCGGPGTEVINPPTPGQTSIQAQFVSDNYSISLTLPPGWTYTEYGPGETPGPNVFTDFDPDTITVAHFQKGLNRFTIFYSLLEPAATYSESLRRFVQPRHPRTGFNVEAVPDEQDAYFVSIDDGDLISVYISIALECVWMKVDLVGTVTQQQQTFEEFGQIVESIQFQ